MSRYHFGSAWRRTGWARVAPGTSWSGPLPRSGANAARGYTVKFALSCTLSSDSCKAYRRTSSTSSVATSPQGWAAAGAQPGADHGPYNSAAEDTDLGRVNGSVVLTCPHPSHFVSRSLPDPPEPSHDLSFSAARASLVRALNEAFVGGRVEHIPDLVTWLVHRQSSPFESRRVLEDGGRSETGSGADSMALSGVAGGSTGYITLHTCHIPQHLLLGASRALWDMWTSLLHGRRQRAHD